MRVAPPALARWLPVIGCSVLALGGLGLGLNFSALIVHLANATPVAQAADISGLITTTAPVGGVVGVATPGSFYLVRMGSGAVHAFAWTCRLMAAAVVAAAMLARASAHKA